MTRNFSSCLDRVCLVSRDVNTFGPNNYSCTNVIKTHRLSDFKCGDDLDGNHPDNEVQVPLILESWTYGNISTLVVRRVPIGLCMGTVQLSWALPI